nr:MAG TPA: hypothetical protein [Caudoviricetes sp.]
MGNILNSLIQLWKLQESLIKKPVQKLLVVVKRNKNRLMVIVGLIIKWNIFSKQVWKNRFLKNQFQVN